MANGFTFKLIEKVAENATEWLEIKKMVQELKTGKAYVKAGIVGDGATDVAEGQQASTVDIALWNEFGTDHIPERSFIRKPFEANRQKYLKALNELLPKVVNKQMTIIRALKLVGLAMATDMKKAILSGSGIPPPNAPSTIAAKGSSRPLVDTGHLVQRISYAAVMPGEAESK